MSGKLINLRRARKDRNKAKTRARADENAAKFGRSAAERRQEADDAARAARFLDHHRRDGPEDD